MSAPLVELTRSTALSTVRHADDPVGNDGLTDLERARYARQYRQGIAAPARYSELVQVRDWLHSTRAQVD